MPRHNLERIGIVLSDLCTGTAARNLRITIAHDAECMNTIVKAFSFIIFRKYKIWDTYIIKHLCRDMRH